jgi:hypothetical protein
MSRHEVRPGHHVQESRTSGQRPAAPAAPTPAPSGSPSSSDEPRHHRGWSAAMMVLAGVFLFLGALAVFDLIAGLVRR